MSMRSRAPILKWKLQYGQTCRLASRSALKMGLPHCGHLVQRPSVRTSWSEGGTISWASRLNQVIEWLLGRLGRPISDFSGKRNARAADDTRPTRALSAVGLGSKPGFNYH